MEATDLAHAESSEIAKRLASRASAEGKNIIWDVTMSSTDSTGDRIKALRDADYTQIDGLFVEIPVETSVQRIDSEAPCGSRSYRSGRGLAADTFLLNSSLASATQNGAVKIEEHSRPLKTASTTGPFTITRSMALPQSSLHRESGHSAMEASLNE